MEVEAMLEEKYAKRMHGFGSDIVEKMFAVALDPEIISFAGGAPAPELYPLDDFRKASDAAFEEYGRTMVAYDGARGIAGLRDYIADKRMQAVGVEAGPDDIMLLSGSQQGADYAARLLVDEGDTIIVEAPSYLGTLNTFSAFRPNYATVGMDENGMIMEELEAVIEANPNAKLIYTVPDFQNPTGITMSAERRKRLVEIATAAGIPIVEDAPYTDISFDDSRVPSVKSFDKSGIVIYLGSFSKIVSPGLRLGWACAHPEIIFKYRKLKEATDLQSSTITQYQLLKYLQMYDLDAHIQNLIGAYRDKRDAILEALEEHMPDYVSYTRPHGGFFTWLIVPGINATELFVKACTEAKVAYVPGEGAFVNGEGKDTIRLSYSQMTPEKIKIGIPRLAALIEEARGDKAAA